LRENRTMPARAAEKIMSWFSAEHLAEVRSAFLLSGLGRDRPRYGA
jgi:hypothetical protein